METNPGPNDLPTTGLQPKVVAGWRMHPVLTFLLGVALVVAAAAVWYFYFRLPGTTEVYDMEHLNKTWTDTDRQWFYHTTQGSQLMPYKWATALEQVNNSKKFIDPEYLSRYRVLTDVNP